MTALLGRWWWVILLGVIAVGAMLLRGRREG